MPFQISNSICNDTKHRTFLLAGHETTSNSLTWALLELAKRPDIQTRLRREIEAKAREIHTHGRVEFTAADYDSMPYLNAVLKVSIWFITAVSDHEQNEHIECLFIHPRNLSDITLQLIVHSGKRHGMTFFHCQNRSPR